MTKEDLISGYFKNTLSTSQRERFDKLLLEDSVFKSEFEEYGSVRNAFKLNEAEALKAKLKAIEASSKPPKLRFLSYIKYTIAASIIAAVGIGIMYKLNTQSIYDEFYKTYPNVYQPVVRSDADANKAFLYYESGAHEKAQQEFQTMLAQEYNPNVAFYCGLSYLETKDFEKAIQQFETINGEDFEFKDELLWYSALAYIGVESYQKASNQLNLLKQNPLSAYRENALTILANIADK